MSTTLLVEQCREHNPKAQLALYKQYCEGMFIVAQRYIKDMAQAEDVMQEAFIKAFSKLHQFKGDVTFGAWLKRIVINQCLDTIKAKKIEALSINEEVLSISEDDDWSVADEVTVAEVHRAIDNLRDPYKVVVQLFLLEGYDHQEISGILGISENASRTNLFRGKKQLQEQLKHLHYGTGY
ncbi:MAG: RNA polymerase sigma factor [Flavobacteriaceae bacterium]|nr:RNA polymerase sigma factor [Flavobacteriaceae bacterium]